MSAVHELKSWPAFFDAILAGTKVHELRVNDRSFSIGDQLLLREYDPVTKSYTGRSATALVTYITSASQPCALSEQALDRNYCILSISILRDASNRRA